MDNKIIVTEDILKMLMYGIYNYEKYDIKIAKNYLFYYKDNLLRRGFNFTDIFDIDAPQLFLILNLLSSNLLYYKNEELDLKILNEAGNKNPHFINKIKDILKFLKSPIEITNYSKKEIEEFLHRFLNILMLYEANVTVGKVWTDVNTITSDDISIKLEKLIAKLNEKHDYIVDKQEIDLGDESSIEDIFDEISSAINEVNVVQLFKDINFIERGRVGIFTAPTGAGKSMVLVSIMGEYLMNLEKKKYDTKQLVFYFTFENTRAETFIRLMARLSGKKINDIKEEIRNNGKEEIFKRYISFMKHKIDSQFIPIIVYLKPNTYNVNQLESIINKKLIKYKNSSIHTVIVDYLDKMRSKKLENDLRLELGYIVDDLKGLSTDYNCAVISATQLNREGIKAIKKGKTPDGSQMGESQRKLENVDINIVFYTIDVGKERHQIKFKVDKHRYDEKGAIITAEIDTSRATIFPINKSMASTAFDVEEELPDDYEMVEVSPDDIGENFLDSDFTNEEEAEDILHTVSDDDFI